MEIDNKKLKQAKLEVAQKLKRAEKERTRLRLQKGVKELESHNFLILLSNHFAEEITHYICEPDSLIEGDFVMSLVNDLGAACLDEKREVRERALVILSVFSEYVLENDRFDFIKKLSNVFMQWLEYEEEYLSGFGVICRQIQNIGAKLLENRCWGEAENILSIVNKIQDGSLKRVNTIKGMVAKIPDNIATKSALGILTDSYLDASRKGHKEAGRILKYLGRRSVIFLINKLMHSKNKIERFRLMGLIPQTGTAVRSVFEECMGKNPPWYVVRNIITMISETGDTSLFYLIEEGLRHPDIRVQKEVINCIESMGGIEVKNRLIEALKAVHDELKVGLVVKLSQFKGNDVAAALINLFEKRAAFADKTADELVFVLCIALKSFPNQRSVQNLKQFVEERKKKNNPSDRLISTAEEILAMIEPKVRHDLKGEADVLEELSFDADPFSEYDAKRKIRDFLDEVQQLVANGNIGDASDMLYKEAERAAKNKDFRVAEILRDKMLEINPIALAEVLELGELIEEEKSTSISSHHIEIWSELYEKMTTEEFNALYSALKREIYNPEEVIIRSGEMDPSLFFINSGIARLSCKCGNRETFLKRMTPGEIIGVGQFFSQSVWTVSLVSQNETQIHVLGRENFLILKDKFPEIEDTLREYCVKFDTVPNLLRMAGEDRREYARYRQPYYVSSITLDPYGRKRQYGLEGEMVDISQGGLSFLLKISKRINTENLLGRQIISEIHLDSKDKLKCSGVIVCIGYPKSESKDLSIHVKFSNLMKQADFNRLNRAA